MFFDNSKGESIVMVKGKFLNDDIPAYIAKIEGKLGYMRYFWKGISGKTVY